jgi:hypothetical protein
MLNRPFGRVNRYIDDEEMICIGASRTTQRNDDDDDDDDDEDDDDDDDDENGDNARRIYYGLVCVFKRQSPSPVRTTAIWSAGVAIDYR